MSNDISYVIKVVDDFSANIKKLQTGLSGVNQKAAQSIQTFNEAQRSTKFFTQNLLDLGKAAGLYIGFQGIKNFGKSLFDTQVQMQGLSASFAAIMPKFDKTRPAAQLAAEEIDYLRDATNRLGVSFEVALPSYMQFLASSKEDLKTTRKSFEAFSGISRLYGLSTQQFQRVVYALGQMQNKSFVKLEELQGQLGDALPGALKLFADATGKTEKEFLKFVSNNQVGAGVIKMVADLINQKFGKDMVAAANTLGGRTAVLGNQWLFLKTVLSDQLSPAMSSSISSMINLTSSAVSLFSAISNQKAFSKLSDEGQALVYTLRLLKDVMLAIAEAGNNISKIGGGFWNLGKDIITTLALGAVQTYGLAEAATGVVAAPFDGGQMLDRGTEKIKAGGMGFDELLKMNQQRYSSEPQKVEVQITLENAPKGTTVSTKTPPRGKVKVGTMTTYETGGGD